MTETSAWLRFLFGLDAGEVPSGGVSRFELTGLWRGGAGWIAFLIIALAIVLIVALYRSERELSLRRRSVLGIIRLLALGVVLWMLLDPRILTEIELRRPATTFVLLDTSGSMSTGDELDVKERRELEAVSGLNLRTPVPRAKIALAALEHEKVLEKLGEKNRVKTFAFDTSLRPVETLDARTFQGPGGDETRLGDAILGALRPAGSDPVAAVVVLSDGRSTAGEAVLKSSAAAAQRGIPVFPVLVGKSRDAKNYAVAELTGPDVAIPGYPVRLESRISVSGIRGAVTVKLLRQLGRGEQKQEIEKRSIEGKSSKYSSSLVFVDTPKEKGSYRYSVVIEKHPEETDKSDNERAVQITVADEKCRVLLIAGGPTDEFVFLSRYLIRDDGLQASCWLSTSEPGVPQDGDVVIRDLPKTMDQLRLYDVVVFIDPDPRVLTDTFLEALKEFVFEGGGGVAYVAGEYFIDDLFRLPRLAPLRAVLPIDFEGATPPGSARRAPAKKAWRPLLTRYGAEHPLCRLADDPDENEKIWSELPGFYYAVSVRALKPAAATLLEREGGDVVAAIEKAGAGTSVFLGTDDLNRWRSWKEIYHERFWGSVIRFLALGKRYSGAGEGTVHVDRDRYAIGEEVVLEANLTDSERKPLLKDRIELAVEMLEAYGAKDGSAATSLDAPVRLNLLPVAGRPGWYTARFRPERPGRYSGQLGEVTAESKGRVAFAVVSPSSEWEDPSPDPATLEELAQSTGGVLLSLAGISELPTLIGDRSITEVIGRSASTVWDSAAVMLLFGILLTLEWALRKLWRLN